MSAGPRRLSRLLQKVRSRRGLALVTAAAVALVGAQIAAATIASAADPLISQGRPVLASSEGGTAYVAKNAVDGSTTTRWASVKATGRYVRMFGTVR